MTRLVALFRGINVGGHNRIPMSELRETFVALGHHRVVSLIQSGNVCFDAADRPEVLGPPIRAAVAERFAIDVPVVLRSAEEMRAILASHPFPVGAIEAKFHHIMFLTDLLPPDTAARLGDHLPGADYVAIDREIHVRYGAGSARSTLTVGLVDRRLSTVATARNLPTCEKIAAELDR